MYAHRRQRSFSNVFPKNRLQLKQFYKRVSSEFNQRESLKLSEMLQESALLHGPTPPPSAAAALPTSGVPESVGPSEVPTSQAALELASSDTPGDPPLPHSSAPTPPHSPQAQVAGPSPNPAAKKKARTTVAQGVLSFGGATDVAGPSSTAPPSAAASDSSKSKCRSCHLYTWFKECDRRGTHKVDPALFPAPVLASTGHSRMCPHKRLAPKVLNQGERSRIFARFTREHKRVFLNHGQGRPFQP